MKYPTRAGPPAAACFPLPAAPLSQPRQDVSRTLLAAMRATATTDPMAALVEEEEEDGRTELD